MDLSDKKRFGALLKQMFASYAQPMPDEDMAPVWWHELSVFPLAVVVAAFDAYRDAEPKFVPHPVAIRKICREQDSRPGAEEAWALALASRDEAETVIWTQEVAQAFAMSQEVLESSGAISARKTFTEIYSRLVSEARAAMRPAAWNASLGWDPARRAVAITRAVDAGLLRAPAVQSFLPPPDMVEQPANTSAHEQLAKIRLMLAEGAVNRGRAHEERLQAERDATERAKRETSDKVDEHLKAQA